ncbi:MAG: hypothetical protein OXC08_10040, partial [Thiotrichales bacterium]|nr:hypothetical protein [Thiotrichales bacterium]
MPPTTTHRAQFGNSIAPWILALVILAGVLWVDVAVKEWAQASLREPVRIASWFYLALHHNSGLFLGTLPVSAVSIVHWPFVFCALAWLVWRMVRTGNSTVGAGCCFPLWLDRSAASFLTLTCSGISGNGGRMWEAAWPGPAAWRLCAAR